MVLKLYGSNISTSIPLVAILEMKLPYELIYLDIWKEEQKTDEYMKMQPFGKVPVLEDDGFLIYESRAICKYLARKYPSGSRLLPEGDAKAYGRFEQACSVEHQHFAPACEILATELVIKPMQGLGPDKETMAKAEKELDTVLAVYEKILASQKYLAGDGLTLVDLFHLPNVFGLQALGNHWKELFEKYPNVDKWTKGLREREAWPRAAAETGIAA